MELSSICKWLLGIKVIRKRLYKLADVVGQKIINVIVRYDMKGRCLNGIHSRAVLKIPFLSDIYFHNLILPLSSPSNFYIGIYKTDQQRQCLG